MKNLTHKGIILVCLLLVTYLMDCGPASDYSRGEETILHTLEPAGSAGTDFRQYLISYMKEEGIPGCAAALIRGGRITWSEGFGVRNTLTRRSVDRETVFEVASNSKIITAYLALRLVDRDLLELDTPLNDYLPEPWLPDPVYRDSITLRHVLSHSSGLGHNGAGRDVQFSPGSGYYYSNLGFNYLQAVIEHITGGSLESAAKTWVFDPIGMTSTSYENPKNLRHRLANGHVSGRYIGSIAAILLLVPLLLLWLPGIAIHRIIRKRWIPGNGILQMGLLLTLILWMAAVFTLFGVVGWIKYAWLTVFFGLIFLGCCAILLMIGFRFIKRSMWRRTCIILVLLSMVAATSLIGHIPVPKWSPIRPMAPASLRTTAGDMAGFLLELSRPVHISDSLSNAMTESQVSLHPQVSWGLGMGIFHAEKGDALWQWGQNVDFQSFTIIYPEQGFGAVVLTNSDWSRPDVAIEIAEKILEGNLDPVIQASHLEFNTSIGE